MKKLKLLFAVPLMVTALISCDKDKVNERFQAIPEPTIDVVAIEGSNNGGNITCEEVSTKMLVTFENSSGRLNYEDYPGGGVVGPITWTTDGTYVSWSSTVPVKVAIIVKGGNGATVYFEDKCLTEGYNLSAPVNLRNGKPYGLSNITFCYNKCEEEKDCETAFAVKLIDYPYWARCFIGEGFDRWGWTNHIFPSKYSYELPMYAGVGQCDLKKGTEVGTLKVENNEGTLLVTFITKEGYTMEETQLYIGTEMFPRDKNNEFTVAPGLYPYKHDLTDADSDSYTISGLPLNDDGLWIIGHAVVCK